MDRFSCISTYQFSTTLNNYCNLIIIDCNGLCKFMPAAHQQILRPWWYYSFCMKVLITHWCSSISASAAESHPSESHPSRCYWHPSKLPMSRHCVRRGQVALLLRQIQFLNISNTRWSHRAALIRWCGQLSRWWWVPAVSATDDAYFMYCSRIVTRNFNSCAARDDDDDDDAKQVQLS